MGLPTGRMWWIAGAAALVLTAAGVWLGGRGDMQYRTAAVRKGTIQDVVSATGNPNAVVTVQVGSQVSGNIQALYADFNTKVTKGQLVARIDPQIFQARVDQGQANLNAAKAAVVNAQAMIQKDLAQVAAANASLADAKANVLRAQVAVKDAKVKLDRRVQLQKEGILSPEDLDTAQATYDTAVASQESAKAQQNAAQQNVKAAEAEVEVARTQLASNQAQVAQFAAALAQAQADLDHTYIRAPVDGIVVARHFDVGQTVAASLQAPDIFDIAQDLTKMQVDTNVSEADIGRVQVGQAATFTVDAYPGSLFQGTVTSIRQAPINVQNVITYDAVISAPNPDLKLLPGMTANVKILVARHDDVLQIPNAALRFRPPQAARAENVVYAAARPSNRSADPVVWVLAPNGKLRAVPVKLGLSDGTFTEVTSGNLQPGDRVVVAAFSKKDQTAAAPFTGGGRKGPGF
ncbi:MAG TPA: efflux RND transporter periplasmic adaptor subunit [Bryobacteraceae bacterium]|nr:efflux RND transporter periplasmic adaptor subunit [Bryobacteraceae bacterium]